MLFSSNFSKQYNHFIVLDFEDYLGGQDPFASEIGAVRIVNSVIVQTFHALIAPTQQLYELLQTQPKRNYGIKLVKKLTGIGLKDGKS